METVWIPLWAMLNVNIFLNPNKKGAKCALNSSPPLNPQPSLQIAQESTWAEKHTAFINLSFSQFFDSDSF